MDLYAKQMTAKCKCQRSLPNSRVNLIDSPVTCYCQPELNDWIIVRANKTSQENIIICDWIFQEPLRMQVIVNVQGTVQLLRSHTSRVQGCRVLDSRLVIGISRVGFVLLQKIKNCGTEKGNRACKGIGLGF